MQAKPLDHGCKRRRPAEADQAPDDIAFQEGSRPPSTNSAPACPTCVPDESSLRHQPDALDNQLADRDAYLKLAEDLEGFLAGLRDNATTASVAGRQRVLRLLVNDVLVGPDRIVIRHAIPDRGNTDNSGPKTTDDDDEEPHLSPSSQLRWRSQDPALWRAGVGAPQVWSPR